MQFLIFGLIRGETVGCSEPETFVHGAPDGARDLEINPSIMGSIDQLRAPHPLITGSRAPPVDYELQS